MGMQSIVVSCLVWVVLVRKVVVGADEEQLVKNLKGQPPGLTFKQYAGYVTIKPNRGTALFYWFVQAQHPKADKLPLALWLNGGPGCSSIGNGLLRELGPFRTTDSGDLIVNKFSWTKAANIIFLDSPYGTGFSYTNTTSDTNSYDDKSIAEDSYLFLLGWFKKFPEYASNDFYLIGESYAGHYIPNLAKVIVDKNKASKAHRINFKGFMIGNPWTDAYYDNMGTSEFYYSHSLISDEEYEAIMKNCDFENDLPVDAGSSNKTCNDAVNNAFDDLSEIDIYNIYGLSCNGNSTQSSLPYNKMRLNRFTAAYDPCNNPVPSYLNRNDVQASLHVVPAVQWSGCSEEVYMHYKKGDITKSMLPVYRQLFKEDLRIWIYSGDVDGVVATIGTRKWIRELHLPIELPWYAWMLKGQVGGWTQKYSKLTFTSVRGAGHLVPETNPKQALTIFKYFLVGRPLPTFSS